MDWTDLAENRIRARLLWTRFCYIWGIFRLQKFGVLSRWTAHVVSRLVSQSVSQLASQPFSQSISYSVSQPVNHCLSVSQSAGQSFRQPASQSAVHSLSQSVSQPVTQPVSHYRSKRANPTELLQSNQSIKRMQFVLWVATSADIANLSITFPPFPWWLEDLCLVLKGNYFKPS
jgi:hypothetical protein